MSIVINVSNTYVKYSMELNGAAHNSCSNSELTDEKKHVTLCIKLKMVFSRISAVWNQQAES